MRFRHDDRCEAVLVPIPAIMADLCDDPRILVACDTNDHAEFGRDGQGRPCFLIDGCIEVALRAVWAAGFRTLGCCCGHGQNAGGIITIDTGTYSLEPRTGTQEIFAQIHTLAKHSEATR